MDEILAVGVGLLVLAGQFIAILWAALHALQEETKLRWRAFVELEKLRCGRLYSANECSQTALSKYLKAVLTLDDASAPSLVLALMEERSSLAALLEVAETRVLSLRCETALRAYARAVHAYHDRLNSSLARHLAGRLGFGPVFDPAVCGGRSGIEGWGVSALATRARDAA